MHSPPSPVPDSDERWFEVNEALAHLVALGLVVEVSPGQFQLRDEQEAEQAPAEGDTPFSR